MSLDTEEVEQEQNEIKELQRQLKETTSLVKNLSSQLNDLQEWYSLSYISTREKGGRGRERGREGGRERERILFLYAHD